MRKRPRALRADPIIEATFEIRFATSAQSAGDLLPGMLFPALRKEFGSNVVTLPLAQVPRMVRNQDPGFAYQATTALVSKDRRLALGERVATLSFPRPYPGWSGVKPIIDMVVEALGRTDLIAAVERISLKYINILTIGQDATDLSVLDVKFSLGSFEPRSHGRMIRAEILHKGCIHIVQVMTGADVTMSMPGVAPATFSGVLVDVDTIRSGPIDDPWKAIPILIDEVHEAEKEVFFGLLTDQSIERMRPIYA